MYEAVQYEWPWMKGQISLTFGAYLKPVSQ